MATRQRECTQENEKSEDNDSLCRRPCYNDESARRNRFFAHIHHTHTSRRRVDRTKTVCLIYVCLRARTASSHPQSAGERSSSTIIHCSKVHTSIAFIFFLSLFSSLWFGGVVNNKSSITTHRSLVALRHQLLRQRKRIVASSMIGNGAAAKRKIIIATRARSCERSDKFIHRIFRPNFVLLGLIMGLCAIVKFDVAKRRSRNSKN